MGLFNDLNDGFGIAAPDEGAASFPTYFKGADYHSQLGSGFSMTSPETWDLTAPLKFTAAAIASGLHGFYNTGVDVSNKVFGTDAEEVNTAEFLRSYDDDLGQYYEDHKAAVDVAGFIGAQFIPGLGAVGAVNKVVRGVNAGAKVLKAADAGIIGANMSIHTGIMGSRITGAVGNAAIDIAAGSKAFALTNQNVVKALAYGFAKEATEAAIWEGAVVATMYKNPVLSDMDGWDLAVNAATGAALGGAIGGVIKGVQLKGQIDKFVKVIDLEEKPFSFIGGMQNSITPDIKASHYLSEYERIANATIDPSLDAKLVSRFTRVKDDTLKNLQYTIREQFQELGHDSATANLFADLVASRKFEELTPAIFGIQKGNLGRMGTRLSVEKQLTEAEAALTKATKDAVAKGLDPVEAMKAIDTPKVAVKYVRTFGEDAGVPTHIAPKVLYLADGIAGRVASYTDNILSAVKAKGFNLSKEFDPSLVTHMDVEARMLWFENASRYNIDKQIKAGETVIHARDIAGMRYMASNGTAFKVKLADGSTASSQELGDLSAFIAKTQQEYAAELATPKMTPTGRIAKDQTGVPSAEEIAKRTDINPKVLDGTKDADELGADALNYREAVRKQARALYDGDLKGTGRPYTDPWMQPQHIKIGYSTASVRDDAGVILLGDAAIKQMQKQAQIVNEQASAAVLGEVYGHLPELKQVRDANRLGSGPGVFTGANADYLTLGSEAERAGQVVHNVKGSNHDAINAEFTPVLHAALNATSGKSLIAFDQLNSLMGSTKELYSHTAHIDGPVLDALTQLLGDIPEPAMIPRKWVQQVTRALGKDGTGDIAELELAALQKSAPEVVPIVGKELQDVVLAHIGKDSEHLGKKYILAGANGTPMPNDLRGTFRVIRPNTKDMQHFAFVVDDLKVSGEAGHVKMLHAANAEALKEMMDRVPVGFQVISKGQGERFHKAIADFEYDKTLHENYIDSALSSKGINAPFLPRTDPKQIADSILSHHLRQSDIITTEAVHLKYQPQFESLKRLGEQATDAATSKYGGSYRYADSTIDNPYMSYVRTALDLPSTGYSPLLKSFNMMLDEKVSSIWKRLNAGRNAAKSGDAAVDDAFAAYEAAGMRTGYVGAADTMYELMNHTAPKGVLTGFIGAANKALASVALRLDWLNGVNNAVGSQVLMWSELNSLMKSMDVGSIKIPGTTESITSAKALVAKAHRDLVHKESREALFAFMESRGQRVGLVKQYGQLIEDASLQGTESVAQLAAKQKSIASLASDLMDKGEKITGNKYMEDYVRFISTSVAKQITDAGIAAGKFGQQEADTIIATFNNRVHGFRIASQRPTAFQGPVGMAVGLFQSYQFNLMQQLFRHVADSDKKSMAIMMGLQGTLYGMNGLPGFQYINSHVVGNASGNKQHKDMYSAAYEGLGHDVGNFIMYGVPSNILNANLYTRGDINPRQATILPSSISEVPIVSAAGAVFTNMKNTANKIMDGGELWTSITQGLEHNGVSRPLSGLGAIMQGYSTTSNGNLLNTYDRMSLNAGMRIAGGKPLDEAITNDAAYRFQVYDSAEREKRKGLASALKSNAMLGDSIDAPDIDKLMHNYVAGGGKQKNFNKWMMSTIKEANTPRVEKIRTQLNKPYAQQMQIMMGGSDMLSAE